MKLADFFQLLKMGNPSKPLIAAALFLGLLETGAGLVVPLLTKNLIDQMSDGGIDWTIIVFLLSAFLFQTVAGGFSFYAMTYVGENIVARLRENLWSRVLDLPVSYFDKHESGETMSRIIQDTNMVKMLVTNHFVAFLSGIVSIVGSVIILLIIDWQITLIMFLSVPLALLAILPLGKIIYKIAMQSQDEMAAFSGHLGRVLHEIRLVKAYNAQPAEEMEGKEEIRRLLRFGLKEAKILAVVSPFMTMLIMLVVVVIIGYGGARVASGAMSPGSLVAIIIYLFQIVMPFSQFASFFTTFQKTMGATERIVEMLKMKGEVGGGKKEIDFGKPLAFHNVSFAYEEGKMALKAVDFTAEPGKTVAFVGPSGGGKTTIFSLIERFYKPTEGMITIGGENIEAFDLHSWRGAIGYVSQESPIISGTIRENICYGIEKPVPEEKVKEAARLANASEFIEKLPQGYDTEVGERGVKLSGGQRQRIAIARALLRDPKLLLLDEATSNLDSESEGLVQEALKNLMKGRTTFIIAHRLSTVVDADTIIVIEDGRVTGQGTHEELLADHALYQKLVKQQFKMK